MDAPDHLYGAPDCAEPDPQTAHFGASSPEAQDAGRWPLPRVLEPSEVSGIRASVAAALPDGTPHADPQLAALAGKPRAAYTPACRRARPRQPDMTTGCTCGSPGCGGIAQEPQAAGASGAKSPPGLGAGRTVLQIIHAALYGANAPRGGQPRGRDTTKEAGS